MFKPIQIRNFIFVCLQAASRVVKLLIEQFSTSYLFGKGNYEFYSRVTGRVLRVQGEWICSFQYPPPTTKGSVQQQMYSNECGTLERYLLGESKIYYIKDR